MSRRRNKRSRRQNGRAEKYTRPEAEGLDATPGRPDTVLDRDEVERQNALQVREAAERAGTLVSDEVESIMGQAEANAEEIKRNAASDAESIRSQAAESASRVVERIETLSGALGEHAEQLRREVEDLDSSAGDRGET